ncbi:hypothetical protein Golax_023372, partial [Gossypium laxum]|nr:hypothetical protein [Gossypium laxum]
MALPSSPSDIHSATPTMASNPADRILLALKTYRLQHFLESCTAAPPRQIMDASGALQENPEFARFEQQDCALASWLLSSVSTGVLPHLIGLDSSAQIWNAIVALYGSNTTSRLMSYRRALHFQRKGDLSMKDFLMKIKNYCDSLASCGEIISDHEHVTAILNGLPPEYESVITIVTASQVPYTVQGVTTILLDVETRQQVVVCEAPSSANLVSSQAPTAVNETVSTP